MSTAPAIDALEYLLASQQWESETNLDILDAESDHQPTTLIASLRQGRNSLQPISRLHPEILDNIFRLAASSRDHFEVLDLSNFIISYVCYTWRVAALDDGSLWRYVDLNGPRLYAIALIDRSAPYTFDLKLGYAGGLESDLLRLVRDLPYRFEYAMLHASRISRITFQLEDSFSIFERFMWPIVLRTQPVLSNLIVFEFGGADDYNYPSLDFSFDELFCKGTPRLSRVDLAFSYIHPSYLGACPLQHLHIPKSLPGSEASSSDWRAVLQALSPTLKDVTILAEHICDVGRDHPPIVLPALQRLKLRGLAPAVEETLSGLILPSLIDFTFEVCSGAGTSVHYVGDMNYAVFFAGVVDRMISDIGNLRQPSLPLTLTTTGEIMLAAVGTGSSAPMKYMFMPENTPDDLVSFSRALTDRLKDSITELFIYRPNRQIYGEAAACWRKLPYSDLDRCLSRLQVLHVDFDSASTIFIHWIENDGIFASIHELHISKAYLRSPMANEMKEFVNAMVARRMARPRVEAVQQIQLFHFDPPCIIANTICNLLGDSIVVMVDGEIF